MHCAGVLQQHTAAVAAGADEEQCASCAVAAPCKRLQLHTYGVGSTSVTCIACQGRMHCSVVLLPAACGVCTAACCAIVQRRDVAVDPDVAELCWDECESSNFQVRSTHCALLHRAVENGKMLLL
jgi:hypothetical protein